MATTTDEVEVVMMTDEAAVTTIDETTDLDTMTEDRLLLTGKWTFQ